MNSWSYHKKRIAWVKSAGGEVLWLEGHGVQTARGEAPCAKIVRETFSGLALSFNQQAHNISQLRRLEQSTQVVSTPLINTLFRISYKPLLLVSSSVKRKKAV